MFARTTRSLRTVSVSTLRARLLSTLTIAEHSNATLNAGTLSAISAARQLGPGPINVLVAGAEADVTSIASQIAQVDGLTKVITVANTAYAKGLPENLAALVAAEVKANSYTHVVASGSAFGRNLLPRVGALLDVQPISDITQVVNESTFVRPIYAGNAIATVHSTDPIKLVTIRASAFAAVELAGASTTIEASTNDPNVPKSSEWISEEITKSERPDLGTAKKVVSGGRGLKDKANFEAVMYPLADALGAAIGASRAAVDAGFCDNSLQVGQTGKVVAPELYLSVGISGAIQHLAGMKDSKTIAAINKDGDAPIFEVADVGLVADLFEAVPELTSKIKA
ncbi:electron transfer flavo protein, alpha subunit [Nadsonia fulvescens var. elongata DSM 6958]|uniref:Probable electron transfer flavoprotein subunit alpha n=1 Tax=Nadsonia fulvescens var. elongata DSM 6958 TaxID=857566 RepID=A0A1E3PHF1_9ASCO|nr:electron transfer flavo protein, alpha subunit [Nadsonia fulvescens var. elongata DSM 6958]